MTSVLFLHGFLGAPSTFDAVAARLPGVRAIAPRLPGHGRPPRMDLPASFDAVVRSIADSLDEPVLVAGYSMGARLGLALALAHPVVVTGAVLVGVNPGLSAALRSDRSAWEEGRAEAVLSLGMDAFVDEWERLELFDSQRRLPAEARAAERARRTAHEPDGIAWAMRALGLSRQPDLRPALAGLRVGVTLLAGELDVKFRTLHAAIAERSRAVEARVVPGCGHNLALEAPEAFASAIAERLDPAQLEKGRIAP